MVSLLPAWGIGQNQLKQLPFSVFHLNTSDGLPQNSVQGFLQDSKGNIWFGTYGGIIKYDGSEVTIFNSETDSNILSNRVIRLTGNARDEIFAATQSRSIIRIGENGSQEFKIKGRGLTHGLSTDEEGNALVFLRNGVVKLVDSSIVKAKEFIDFQIPHEPTQAYYSKEDQTAYYLTSKGLFIITDEEMKQHPFYKGKFLNGMLKVNDNLYIHSAATTDLWIGDSLVKQIPNSYRKADRMGFARSTDGVVREAHDNGIRKISPDFSCQDFGKNYYLPALTYRSVFVDVEQNVWLGSNDNGLVRIRPDLFNTYIDPYSPGSFNLQGIYPDSHGI